MKTIELIPVFDKWMPFEFEIEEGKIYISEYFGVAMHLCACGCKRKTITELKPVWKDGWELSLNENKITLRPSIGNFNGENPYHAHYWITKNKIEWC